MGLRQCASCASAYIGTAHLTGAANTCASYCCTFIGIGAFQQRRCSHKERQPHTPASHRGQLKPKHKDREDEKRMDYFNRRRNIQAASGEPYDYAFTQTEILERGWTVSMIRRHLGKPNAVVQCPLKYQYDRRRVYATEATPALQFDLLATEDIRLCGPRWLNRFAAYIPGIMKASLLTRAGREAELGNGVLAAEFTALAHSLPPAMPPVCRTAPQRPPAPPKTPVTAAPPPPGYPSRPNTPSGPVQAILVAPIPTIL